MNVWNLPNPPPATSPDFAEAPEDPIALENVSNFPQGDLTSLDWNFDGTLLAIGSYDSILRVCTSSGALYFSHPQHQVGIKYLVTITDILNHHFSNLERVPYLLLVFRRMALGF